MARGEAKKRRGARALQDAVANEGSRVMRSGGFAGWSFLMRSAARRGLRALPWCALMFVIMVRSGAIELEAIHPIGAARGTTNKFTTVVKPDNAWPAKFWSDPPGLKFVAETNKNRVAIEIAKDAAPGPRLVRAYDTNGVSEFAFFVVGDGNEVEEVEPNDLFSKAQASANLPVTISGRLNKRDDVDSFEVRLPAGGWLDASVESFVYMSKMDAVLRLVTTNGLQLAWNHDFATFDPRLQYRATDEQRVVVQVFGFVYPANNEIRLTGGEQCFYRLNLSTNAPVAIPARESTNLFALPFETRGTISAPGEEDRVAFKAGKDSFVEARVDVAAIGSALDPVLRVLDSSGKELARNDDFEGGRDALLEWKAPAETNYFLAISSLLNRGASNYTYRLSAITVGPEARATWSGSSAVLSNGVTNTLKFDLKRLRGHTNELAVTFRNLPEGVSAVATNLPSAVKGEVAVSLAVATNAPAWQGPIQAFVGERPALFDLISRGENNGVPQGYNTLAIPSTPHFWITVKGEPAPATVTTNLAGK